MKKKLITFLMMISIVLFAGYLNVEASGNTNSEEYAEPTDIREFIDEIEVLNLPDNTGKARAVSETTEDYRAWTQDDARWGTIELGKSGNTMKNSGCLVTSVCKLIIQSELKNANSFTPQTLVTWLNSNGGFTDGGGLYWAKPAEYVSGLSYYGNLMESGEYSSSDTANISKIISWIKDGYHMVLQVKNGGHWVAVDEAKTLETGTIYIMDSLPSNVNADITLNERYTTFNRISAYKGGKTPDVSGDNTGSSGTTDDTEHVHDYERTVYSKATSEKTGKLKDTCKTCGHVKYVTISRIDTVSTQYKMYIYNGKVRKPKVIVTNKMGNVINPNYYTLTYSEGRKNVGKYSITVKFKERYTGTYTITYSIIPQKTSILKLTSKEKAFNVKWEKIENEVGWYEIRYSTTSDFSKNVNTKRVSNKYSSSTVRDLKADTTYYVKMRTYKKVDGVRYYAGWTPVETVKTK